MSVKEFITQGNFQEKGVHQTVDPYGVITDFFLQWSLPDYRKGISCMLKAAYSNDYWRESPPIDVLDLCSTLGGLMDAAFLLVKDQTIRKKYERPEIAGNWKVDFASWDYFPRYLSFKEFFNPYRVFKRFFKYRGLAGWKDDLFEVAGYALSSDSNVVAGVDIDYLGIYLHLQKLVEAAYLIHVSRIENETKIDNP